MYPSEVVSFFPPSIFFSFWTTSGKAQGLLPPSSVLRDHLGQGWAGDNIWCQESNPDQELARLVP